MQDNIPMDPYFLRHGESCKAHIRRKSCPKFNKVCFKPMKDVSVCFLLHASSAANCPSASRSALARHT